VKPRIILIALLLIFVSGCDDDVAVLSDEAFHEFHFKKDEDTPATQLVTVKSEFPDYSQEFVWHKDGAASLPANRNQVVLIYKTRNGNFYLHFEDGNLINKRKVQYRS